jgi:hypothetical protein
MMMLPLISINTNLLSEIRVISGSRFSDRWSLRPRYYLTTFFLLQILLKILCGLCAIA